MDPPTYLPTIMKRIQENEIFIPELLSTHAQDIIIRSDLTITKRLQIVTKNVILSQIRTLFLEH